MEPALRTGTKKLADGAVIGDALKFGQDVYSTTVVLRVKLQNFRLDLHGLTGPCFVLLWPAKAVIKTAKPTLPRQSKAAIEANKKKPLDCTSLDWDNMVP